MKIKVALSNSGGELDSQTFEVAIEHHDFDEAVAQQVNNVIDGWSLMVGDTITVREIEG